MTGKGTGILAVLGALFSAGIVGYLVHKENERAKKETDELVKTTTEQIMKDAFPKVEFDVHLD
jgi:predicted transcriptional regulator